MFLTNRTNGSTLKFLTPVLIIWITCIVEVQGQQGGANRPSMRDQARAIQRAEMDRLLLMAVPAKTDSQSNRVAVMKQIRADFKDLQELNNKMMSEAWARETLDYSLLSDMVSRIRGKATRLKLNLNLPASGDLGKASDPNISSSSELRAALLVLDRAIMSFVNNPLFKEPNTIEVSQATRARQDLESVIKLTAELKKLASSLAKVSKAKVDH